MLRLKRESNVNSYNTWVFDRQQRYCRRAV